MAKTPLTPFKVYVKSSDNKFGTPVDLADLLQGSQSITSLEVVGNTMTLSFKDHAGEDQTVTADLITSNTLVFDEDAKTIQSTVNGVASAAIDVTSLSVDINVDTVEWDQGTFILKLTETSPDGGVTPGVVHNINLSSLVPVDVDMSVTGDGTAASPLKLVNDTAAPGSFKVYGTDADGNKGWQPVAADDLQIATDEITAVIVEDIPLEGFGDAEKALWAPAVWLKVVGPDGNPLLSGGKTVLMPGYLAD